MDIQEIIRAAQEENAEEMNSFQVDEWSTEKTPFIIYNSPFTLSDLSWIEKQAAGDHPKSLACTVIRKAQDAEGKKIFTIKDLKFLTVSVSSPVVVSIVNKMNQNEPSPRAEEEE